MNRNEIDKAYSEFITAPKHPYWQKYFYHKRDRFKYMVDSLANYTQPITVLDIGPTIFTKFIKEVFPNYEISTIDLNGNYQKMCDETGIQLKICDIHERHIPFPDDYFDVVTFCGVLEHLFAPPTEIMNEIRRIMRPKGKLIFTVPNIARLDYRIKFLFGITPLQNADWQLRDGMHGHIHEYTMKECISLLNNCNFSILKRKYVITNVFANRWSRLFTTPLWYAMHMIPSFAFTIYIECEK